MAKDKNGTYRTIAIIIGALAVFGGGVAWLVTLQDSVGAARTHITTYTVQDQKDNELLKAEGCKPSRANTTDIKLIQKDISTIQEDQTAMSQELEDISKQQTESFHEILKRLPDDG